MMKLLIMGWHFFVLPSALPKQKIRFKSKCVCCVWDRCLTSTASTITMKWTVHPAAQRRSQHSVNRLPGCWMPLVSGIDVSNWQPEPCLLFESILWSSKCAYCSPMIRVGQRSNLMRLCDHSFEAPSLHTEHIIIFIVWLYLCEREYIWCDIAEIINHFNNVYCSKLI